MEQIVARNGMPADADPRVSTIPVTAPAESRWQWVRQTLRQAGPGQVIFSINNACNAGCGFCSFALDVLPRPDWRFVPAADACRALDVLAGLFVRYLIISGGEPTLPPELDAIVRHASQRHMSVLLVSNGSRLSLGSKRIARVPSRYGRRNRRSTRPSAVSSNASCATGGRST